MMADVDLTTLDGVRTLMASSKNTDEWNANCRAVRAANGGYPEFWYKEIIFSGFAREVTDRFGGYSFYA